MIRHNYKADRNNYNAHIAVTNLKTEKIIETLIQKTLSKSSITVSISQLYPANGL